MLLARVRAIALVLLALASILPARSLLAQGVGIGEATELQKREAQAHYEKGAKLFELKKLEDALKAFKQSYDVVRSPNAHLMISRALLEMGEILRAHQELVATEAEAKGNERYASTAEKARALRADLEKKVALVRVTAKGGDPTKHTVRVGTTVMALDEERPFFPATVQIELLEGTTVKATMVAALAAGDKKSFELSAEAPAAPPPPPQLPPPPPPAPRTSVDSKAMIISGVVIGVVGLAGIGVGTSLFFLAKSDADNLDATCGATGKQCPAGSTDLIDTGRGKLMGSQIAFALGGGLAAVGTGVFIGGLATKPDKKEQVSLSVGLGSAWLSGRF
ncbi:MAG: hypothetical protein JNK04_22135 [Myxococcales bacterium]|nr:hypothetical protein [Myxococcales bacterium]